MSSPTPQGRLPVLAVVVLAVAGCLAPAGVGADATPTAAPSGDDAPSATGADAPATTESAVDSSPGETSTPHPETVPAVRATVVDVIDGDTVRVRFPNGTRDTVRLLGVDTPEVFSENTPGEYEGVPDTAAGRDCLGRYGEAASEYARERLAGRTVGLAFDSLAGRRGYYDRLLAYVYVDGEQFNRDLLREGYARFYESRFLERERYAAAERRARAADRGLWTCADASERPDDATARPGTATPTGRADGGDGRLVVSVHADAAGDDRENLNDEYVRLRNVGDATLDLSGWTVEEGDGRRYAFAAGTTLDPGETIVLHTGSGDDTATDRYWGRGAPVWNNDGDRVVVADAAGTVVVSKSY
jgi:micrococcal nuclease